MFAFKWSLVSILVLSSTALQSPSVGNKQIARLAYSERTSQSTFFMSLN